MSLLRKLVGFGIPKNNLVLLYIIFIRSKLEYCCVLWHSSITQEEITNLDRVQKCAVRVIMGEEYEGYEESLSLLNLEDLTVRRESLCLDFAKQCLLNPKTMSWFPTNPASDHDTRNPNTFLVQHANNERLKNSTIPYLQRLLNKSLN